MNFNCEMTQQILCDVPSCSDNYDEAYDGSEKNASPDSGITWVRSFVKNEFLS